MMVLFQFLFRDFVKQCVVSDKESNTTKQPGSFAAGLPEK